MVFALIDRIPAFRMVKKKSYSKDELESIATRHILGITSLWLLIPVYVAIIQQQHLDLFGIVRLTVLVCATLMSVVYWGYYNDEKSLALRLDTSFARTTALLHLLYALTLPIEYKAIGVFGTAIVSLLYRASYNASTIKAPWRVKVSYHLLFRYVGFWEVFILCSHGALISVSSWILVFIMTSSSYFAHAYIVFNKFTPIITYEYQIVIMGLFIAFIGLFIHCVLNNIVCLE